MAMDGRVYLLETTLRDGSYEIDFQWTAADTALIVGGLDRAGFRYIEICHGNGIGADDWAPAWRSKQRAAATDEEHLAAAHSVAERAEIGVLFHCGTDFTPPASMSIVSRHGARFVRLAVRPDHVDEPFVEECIDRANELGLLASINLMQTAAIPVAKVAEAAKRFQRRGAQWFYVVDSAGSLTPQRTQEYVRAIRDASGMVVGIHAHNNSAMALANSLAAVEAGATLLDATLQGIGRATGNASTEQTLLALQRLGHETGVERELVFQLGQTARSLFAERGNDPTSFVSGAAGIHSRALPGLKRLAEQRGRSARELVLRVGAEAEARQCHVRDLFAQDLVEAVIGATPAATIPVPAPGATQLIAQQIGRQSAQDLSGLGALCDDVIVRSFKRRKPSVLHLVPADEFFFAGALPWESGDLVGVTIPVAATAKADPTGGLPRDRFPDVLALDDALVASTLVQQLPRPGKHSVSFSFRGLLADAIVDLARLQPRPLWLPERGTPLLELVASRLRERGLGEFEAEPTGAARVIIARAAAPAAWLQRTRGDDLVILVDAPPNARSVVDEVRARGARIVRPLLPEAIAGRVAALVQMAARSQQDLPASRGFVDPYVAPASREVVLDAIEVPGQIVDSGGQPIAELALTVAATRALALLSGKGQI